MLTVIRLLAAFGTAAMATAIIGAFGVASFPADGEILTGLTWGRVTLVDIYLAFVFGWLWIAWRERSVTRAIAWLAVTLVAGSLALFGYLLGAAMRSDSVDALVLGPHRSRVGTDGREMKRPPGGRSGGT